MTDPALAWLYSLEQFGIKLGLDTVRTLFAELGRPDEAFPSILVGGTNGKGSVAAGLESVLAAAGLVTGLYTSPHLIRVEERIRIRGVEISRAELALHLNTVRAVIDASLTRGVLAQHPSFFEVMTATALLAFRAARVDVAVLEVGLGGRLDATNAVEPVVSVVVGVDLDHTDRLGNTLAEIALEKAGIVRAGRPFISGATQAEVRDLLRAAALRTGARWIDARTEARLEETGDRSFAVTTARAAYANLRLPLPGKHQLENARVTVVVAEAAADALRVPLTPEAVRHGLAALRWPGRLQWIEGAPSILLDGAHNPAGAEALAGYLRERGGPLPVLLFGATRGKDAGALLAALRPVVAELVLTRSRVERSADPAELAGAAGAGFPRLAVIPDPGEALRLARELATGRSFVLVAGSLYLVGEILRILEGDGDDTGPGPISL